MCSIDDNHLLQETIFYHATKYYIILKVFHRKVLLCISIATCEAFAACLQKRYTVHLLCLSVFRNKYF